MILLLAKILQIFTYAILQRENNQHFVRCALFATTLPECRSFAFVRSVAPSAGGWSTVRCSRAPCQWTSCYRRSTAPRTAGATRAPGRRTPPPARLTGGTRQPASASVGISSVAWAWRMRGDQAEGWALRCARADLQDTSISRRALHRAAPRREPSRAEWGSRANTTGFCLSGAVSKCCAARRGAAWSGAAAAPRVSGAPRSSPVRHGRLGGVQRRSWHEASSV